jgi:hypothetical protein
MHTSTNAVQALDVPAGAQVTFNDRLALPGIIFFEATVCIPHRRLVSIQVKKSPMAAHFSLSS